MISSGSKEHRLRVMMISEYPRKGIIIGGVQTAVWALTRSLSEHPDIESVHVFDFRYDLDAYEEQRFSDALVAHYVPAQKLSMPTLMLKDILAARMFAHRFNPDIVHAQGIGAKGHLAVSLGRPTVLTIHGVGNTEILKRNRVKLMGYVRAGFTELFTRHACLRAKGVVAISRFSRSYYFRNSRRRVVEIPNAVGEEFFTREWNAPRENRIVFAGVLLPIKHVNGMIRAFARVRKAVPDAVFDIVGPEVDQAYAKEIRKNVAELQLESAVAMHGNKSSEEVASMMHRAKATVLFSEHENAPCVVAESLAVGTPVVASSVGAVPEMVAHGETGFLVAPGDEEGLSRHLITLLRDSAMHRCISKTAAERASALWRPSSVADATIAFYKEILGNTTRNPR